MVWNFRTALERTDCMSVFVCIILLCIALDQITKLFAIHFLSTVTTVPIIPNVLHLTYVQNDGAAFSLLSGHQIFLIVVTLLFIVLLIYFLYSMPKKRATLSINIALAMIIGGAIGNLIDRIRFQYVVDFFDFRLIGFAIFNVADVFVVTGCIVVILAVIRGNFPSGAPASESKKD